MAEMAITAVVTGEAAVSVATVAAAAAEVGTVMSVVGAVTGDKNLAKLGATIGIVGGISSLATSALTDEAAKSVLTQEAVDDGLTQGITDQIGSDAAAKSAGDVATATNGITQDVSNTALQTPVAGVTPNAPQPIDSGINTATNAQIPPAETLPNSASETLNGVDSPSVPNSPSTPYDANIDEAVGQGGVSDAQAGKIGNSLAQQNNQSSDFWNKLSSFAGKNGNGLLMVGGMALKGASDTSIANQKNDTDRMRIAIEQQRVNQNQYGSSLPALRSGLLTRV